MGTWKDGHLGFGKVRIGSDWLGKVRNIEHRTLNLEQDK